MPRRSDQPPPFPVPDSAAAHDAPGVRDARRVWQFSLRRLFAAMTALALFCFVCFALPAAFSQFIVGALQIAIAGVLLTGLFFAAGDQRAFCLGAAVVFSSMWTGVGGQFMEAAPQLLRFLAPVTLPRAANLWLDFAVLCTAAMGNGALCVVARSYFQRGD